MENLIYTDAGLLSIDNLEYLYSLGVINREGGIKSQEIKNSSFKRPVQLWSMFCLIKEDITRSTGVSDLNQVVNIMRQGQYDTEKKYPKVESIIQKGTQLVFEAYERQGGSKSKKVFDDFDI